MIIEAVKTVWLAISINVINVMGVQLAQMKLMMMS